VGERGGREGGGKGMAAEKVGCMRQKAKGSGWGERERMLRYRGGRG